MLLRRWIAIALVLAVAGQASAAVTPYLDPLRAQHQRLIRLRGTMEDVFQARPWDAARAQAVGAEFLSEARGARKLIGQFCNAKGRKLETEFDEINASIAVMGDTFMMYRTMKGAAAPVATTADEASVRSGWNTLLRDYARMKFDERLGVEGLAEILTAGSFKQAVDTALEQARPKLQERVEREMERVTGLRIHDRRSLGAVMEGYAKREVEKGFAKLLVKITSNELIIEWAAGVLIRWIGPKLKEALRQKGNLVERTTISLRTLESARRALNALPGSAALSNVSREVRRAKATIAATKFLQHDLTRARRVDLNDQLGQGIERLERALTLTAVRFPARDCAEEIPDWDEALAKLDRELQRLIAMPLVQQPLAQVSPVATASPVAPAATPSATSPGSRDWVVYINMEEFTCCKYDPGWRDRYPNFGPDDVPRTLSITFLSSAQKDPKKRIVSQPFKTHADAKAWLCTSHKVVRYGRGTIARVAGIIVVLGGICPANSPE